MGDSIRVTKIQTVVASTLIMLFRITLCEKIVTERTWFTNICTVFRFNEGQRYALPEKRSVETLLVHFISKLTHLYKYNPILYAFVVGIVSYQYLKILSNKSCIFI